MLKSQLKSEKIALVSGVCFASDNVWFQRKFETFLCVIKTCHASCILL